MTPAAHVAAYLDSFSNQGGTPVRTSQLRATAAELPANASVGQQDRPSGSKAAVEDDITAGFDAVGKHRVASLDSHAIGVQGVAVFGSCQLCATAAEMATNVRASQVHSPGRGEAGGVGRDHSPVGLGRSPRWRKEESRTWVNGDDAALVHSPNGKQYHIDCGLFR